MCILCDALKNDNKEIKWEMRSTYADDNICDFVNGGYCSNCKGCNTHFKLAHYNYQGYINVGVEFHQTITTIDGEDVVIKPFSETIPFNFCPVCGEKITLNDVKNDKLDYLEYYLKVSDRED